MKECPYTASSRDVSENTPPSALEISLVRGFCTPRPSRLPSGFALGQSLGPRGAKSPPLGNLLGLGGCIFRYIPPLGSVRIQYDFSIKSGHMLFKRCLIGSRSSSAQLLCSKPEPYGKATIGPDVYNSPKDLVYTWLVRH